MLYLSQMTGKPVVDATGEKIGTISDLAISTGEVFPAITSLAFQGPGKVPFMISWRKYVGKFDEDGICYVQLEGGEKTIYMTIKRGNGYATSTTKYILPNEFNN